MADYLSPDSWLNNGVTGFLPVEVGQLYREVMEMVGSRGVSIEMDQLVV
ncbi:MAG TPA: hypothetical protein VI816_01810 [Candidatus Bathyarchaeia archaeon]|nr:hypothetical protein [Candidatus Bathyarchaeia archaeon]